MIESQVQKQEKDLASGPIKRKNACTGEIAGFQTACDTNDKIPFYIQHPIFKDQMDLSAQNRVDFNCMKRTFKDKKQHLSNVQLIIPFQSVHIVCKVLNGAAQLSNNQLKNKYFHQNQRKQQMRRENEPQQEKQK